MARVNLYYAPSVMKFGSKELAPQTVWAIFDQRKFGGNLFWEAVVVGTDDTKHLVDDSTVQKALAASMPFSFGLDVLCPSGVKELPVEEIAQFHTAAEMSQQKSAQQEAQTPVTADQSMEKELIALVKETGNSGIAPERVVRLNQLWIAKQASFVANDKAYALLIDKFRDTSFDAIDEGNNWKAPLDNQLRHIGSRIALLKGNNDKKQARINSWIAFYGALAEYCGKGPGRAAGAVIEQVLHVLNDSTYDWDRFASYAVVEQAVVKIQNAGGTLSAQAACMSELAFDTLPKLRQDLEYAKALDDRPVYAQVTYTESYLTGGICDVLANPMFEAWNAEPTASESRRLEAWFESYIAGMSEAKQRETITYLLTLIKCMCPSGTSIVIESNGNIKIPFTDTQLPSYGSFVRYLINVALRRLDNPEEHKEDDTEPTGNPTDSPFIMSYLMQCSRTDSPSKRNNLMSALRSSYSDARDAMLEGDKDSVRKVRIMAEFINSGMPGLQPVNRDYWEAQSLDRFLMNFCKPFIEEQLTLSNGAVDAHAMALQLFSHLLTSLTHWRNDAESVNQWLKRPAARLYNELFSMYSSTLMLAWVRENIDASSTSSVRDSLIAEAAAVTNPCLLQIAKSVMTLALSDTIDGAINELRAKSVKQPAAVYEELRRWFAGCGQAELLPVSLTTTISYIWDRIRPVVAKAKPEDREDALRDQCFAWRDMLMQLRPLDRDTLQWASAKYSPDNIAEAMDELKRTAANSEKRAAKIKMLVNSFASSSASETIWEVHTNEAQGIRSLGETVICYASLVENVKSLRSKLSKLPDLTLPEADFVTGRQDALLAFDRNVTVDGFRKNILHKWIVANEKNLNDTEDMLDACLDTIMEMRPLQMAQFDWSSNLPTGLSLLNKFIVRLQLSSAALSREMNIALGVYSSMQVPADTQPETKKGPSELEVNKPVDGKISHRTVHVSGSAEFSSDVPDIPAAGIDVDDLFDMSSPLAQRMVNMLRRSNSTVWELDKSITEDLAKNTKYLGLKKRLQLENFVVVGGNDGSSCLTVSLAGKRVGVLTLDPVQIARLAGGFTTTSILHVATHEIAHFIFRQLKNTEKMDWRKEVAGRKLHPRQGADKYGFESEQFAILAETMVWGNSFRGLYTTNGMSVVEKYFYNNFITEEDKKKRA